MVDKLTKIERTKEVFGIIGVCGVVGNLVTRVLIDNGLNAIGTDSQSDENCNFKYTLDNYSLPLYLGGHPEKFFHESDYIIPPPSLPEESNLKRKLNNGQNSGLYQLLEVDDVIKAINPDKPVLCITGTNGKTTTVSILKHICLSNGLIPVEHGFKNLQGNIEYIPPLQSRLKGDVAVLETGTFGKEGDLRFMLERSQPGCGIITNITPDHMPKGQGFLEYALIKGEFVDYLKDKKLIVNGDDPTVWGLITSKINDYQTKDIITFGVDSSDSKLKKKMCWCGQMVDIKESISGMGEYKCSCGLKKPPINYLATDIEEKRFKLITPYEDINIETSLSGLHNVYNVLGAVVAAIEFFKIPLDQIICSITDFKGIPGRMDYIGEIKSKEIIVDYAHNPGGVETLLRELQKVYESIAVVITISSESGKVGDMEILKNCIEYANYVIPASYYSRKAAETYLNYSKNEPHREKLVLPPQFPAEFKKGTLGANKDQILNGLETSLKCPVSAVIIIGEAAFKFKDQIKSMVILNST